MIKLRRINPIVWEIPEEKPMNVPVRIYASEKLLEKMKQDRTLEQARNVASLPDVLPNVLVMPDGHEGYGFPIGGVAAFPAEGGLVSPGGIGYDINCGVRLLLSSLTYEEVRDRLPELVNALFRAVPSGVGSRSDVRVSREEFMEVLSRGVKWAIKEGFASGKDAEHIEEKGSMEADPSYVSDRAVARGISQLGTLGAGNHFLEVQRVERITDEEVAKKFGLFENQIVVMIHTGSRGFGHQVASDYIKVMLEAARKYGIRLPDRELAAAPLESEEAMRYIEAMKCAVNFAFTNRQIITYKVREVFEKFFGEKLELLYDVAHNIGKFERHRGMEVFVHRKGATRAFGPGREDIPEDFRKIGQPVIIPGSMGTASYVLAGLGAKETFESTCHGAGRLLSRAAAKRQLWGAKVKKELESRGILVRSASMPILAEEAPQAYKDVDEVVRVVQEARISSIVSRNVPLAVVKG